MRETVSERGHFERENQSRIHSPFIGTPLRSTKKAARFRHTVCNFILVPFESDTHTQELFHDTVSHCMCLVPPFFLNSNLRHSFPHPQQRNAMKAYLPVYHHVHDIREGGDHNDSEKKQDTHSRSTKINTALCNSTNDNLISRQIQS